MKDVTIIIEAAQFDSIGGWVVDQQFMDQMHAPFLLAHGLGNPVEDATTAVNIPHTGVYHVWVRTRNWAAPSNHVQAVDEEQFTYPGKFQLLINSVPLDVCFGTGKSEWSWQYGKTVVIDKKKNIFSLHDLSGFDGRCDAIVLSTNSSVDLPQTGPELIAFRRKMNGFLDRYEDESEFDYVVVGGGVAGICAAVSAARNGLMVALIHNRPILGGNNSSEVRVQLGGKVNLPPYPAIGNVVNEIDHKTNRNARPKEEYRDDLKMNIVESEKNINLFLDLHVVEVEMQNGIIASVIAQGIRTGKRHKFKANIFADCTGDANLGYLAGAEYRMGRESQNETGESLAPEESDNMTLGTSVMWYSEESDRDESFPETPWAPQFTEETCQKAKKGDWDWEAGIGRNHIDDFEYIRDYGLLAAYGNWSFLKNHSSLKEEYANRKLAWVAYIGGKRESRRLLGDVILQQQDIEMNKHYPDACITTSWSIDLHYPKIIEGFEGESFRARAKKTRIEPYAIPFRTLYSRNVHNLLMAGRNISVTHVALGTVRVMKTTGMMGEVIGLAAAFCKAQGILPKDIFCHHLPAFLDVLERGVPDRKE